MARGVIGNRRLTLGKPRFSIKISYITIILTAVVIAMPLSLTVLVVDSVDRMVEANIPRGQGAACRHIADVLHNDLVAPQLNQLQAAKRVLLGRGEPSPSVFNLSHAIVYELPAGQLRPPANLSRVRCPRHVTMRWERAQAISEAILPEVSVHFGVFGEAIARFNDSWQPLPPASRWCDAHTLEGPGPVNLTDIGDEMILSPSPALVGSAVIVDDETPGVTPNASNTNFLVSAAALVNSTTGTDDYANGTLTMSLNGAWLLASQQSIPFTAFATSIIRADEGGATVALLDAREVRLVFCEYVEESAAAEGLSATVVAAAERFWYDSGDKLDELRSCAAVRDFIQEKAWDIDRGARDPNFFFQYEDDSFYFTVTRVAPREPSTVAVAGSPPAWLVVRVTPTSSYLGKLLRTRGRIAVTAFAIAAVTVSLLLLMMRSVLHPLKALGKAIHSCATMDLEGIEIMEASSVAEITEIQRSVSYLAIRLYHYLRFLPDRVILSTMHDKDEETRRVEDAVDLEEPLLVGGFSTDVMTDSSGSESSSSSDDEEARQEQLRHYLQDSSGSGAPEHSIMMNVLYESRHSQKNTIFRKDAPNKTASFQFRHRVTDPVHTMLLRSCRVHLNERPGEVLVMFVQTDDGKRQLTTDEDVLFAIEYFARHGDIPSLDITVRKGANRAVVPLFIAVGTMLSFFSRMALGSERMDHPDNRVQLLGLLLLACLAMQVAQNSMISWYLINRFKAMDSEFRAWHLVSKTESVMGIFFGCFNVTNLEVMACQVRLHRRFRLSAPLTPILQQKIRKYSFLGFIVGDVLPFLIIAIDTLLRQRYQDPLIIVPLFFSVLSVTAILIRHGIIRLIIDDVVKSKDSIRSLSTKSLVLSRKDVTVLRVAVTQSSTLLEFLSPGLIDHLTEKLLAVAVPIAKKFGGMVVSCSGLSMSIVFNAHTVVPHHAHSGYSCFLALQEAVEVSVLCTFFESEVMRLQLTNSRNEAIKKYGFSSNMLPTEDPIASGIRFLHTTHRVVGSIVTGEMCLGYVGTLTSQTFQHVDATHHLSNALCQLNEHYGTTLLMNEVATSAPRMSELLLRRIDKLTYDASFFARSNLDDDTLHPYPVVVVYETVVTEIIAGEDIPMRTVLDIHKRRFIAPSPATAQCVVSFDAAMDFLFSVSSAVAVTKHVKNYPTDHVAAFVLQWAKFFGATNEVSEVTFPRPLTQLGLQRHRCERPEGLRVAPLFLSDAADRAIKELGKGNKKAAKLRPPRSERRAKDTRLASSTNISVLEQVIGKTEFSVDFGPPPSSRGARLPELRSSNGSPTRKPEREDPDNDWPGADDAHALL